MTSTVKSNRGAGRLKIVDATELEEKLTRLAEEPPLSMAVIDIDEFKSINDTYGHPFGDKVLTGVVTEIAVEAGTQGWVARVGGDAFACLLPSTSPEQAVISLDRARESLAKPRVFGKVKMPIPISIGIAAFPHHAEDPAELQVAAWAALEKAKREGKNRAVIYVEERMVLKSNYYPRAQLARLAGLAQSLGRTEAALLREALGDALDKYRDVT